MSTSTLLGLTERAEESCGTPLWHLSSPSLVVACRKGKHGRTHLDIPIDESKGVREHPEKLTDSRPSPICPKSLYERGQWWWRFKTGDGRDSYSGYCPSGHDRWSEVVNSGLEWRNDAELSYRQGEKAECGSRGMISQGEWR